MMKILATTMLFAQMISTGNHRKIFPSSGCTPPTETSRWPSYGAGVTCLSGPCSGQDAIRITSIPDVVGTNHLVDGGGLARPQFYAAGGTGFASLASAHFAGGETIALTTAIPASVTTYSYWATIQPNTTAVMGILGGAAGALEYRLDSGNHQQLLVSNTSVIGTGTAVFASGAKYTIGFTLDTSTGAWNLYKCSGGTCTSDGSGTAGAVTFTNPITAIGVANGISDIFNGLILESAFYNGISTSGWGTWSQCNAGI